MVESEKGPKKMYDGLTPRRIKETFASQSICKKLGKQLRKGKKKGREYFL